MDLLLSFFIARMFTYGKNKLLKIFRASARRNIQSQEHFLSDFYTFSASESIYLVLFLLYILKYYYSGDKYDNNSGRTCP